MSNVTIEAKDLSFTYSAKSPFEKVALKKLSFKIYEGETVGIIGSTGSGKSTLVQHFNALIKLSEGNLNVCGFDLAAKKIKYKDLRRKIGMLFQYPEYQLFEDTVLKDVCFGPNNFGFSKEESIKAAEEALALVGLDVEDIKEKSPFELSGGQQRRVAIAGVIASKPEVLVLDEPTSGLDPVGKKAILDLAQDLKQSFCKTVIMISHNMDEIAQYCERVIVLNEGEIVFDGSQKDFFNDPSNLADTGLKLPHTVAIKEDLKAQGMEISKPCLDVFELADEIEKYLRLSGAISQENPDFPLDKDNMIGGQKNSANNEGKVATGAKEHELINAPKEHSANDEINSTDSKAKADSYARKDGIINSGKEFEGDK